jgi:aspartyl-tRNA(Asn)/glutamyl-tRNA(Gln) amidotransferase subunit B
MRCEPNVSISKTDKLGTKVEVKNIGSIAAVGEAIKYEVNRQIDILEKGEVLKEQTRRFDDKTRTTILMRYKETGNDYRYFPEPDLPFVHLTDDFINNSLKDLERMPDARRVSYRNAGILPINIEKIISNKRISDYLERFQDINLVIASNLLLGDIEAYLNKSNKTITETKLTDNKFRELVNKLDSGKITNKIFKEILTDLMETDNSIDEILESKGLNLSQDDGLTEEIINKVLSENENLVTDYKNGNERVTKALMGLVMKEAKGRINPSVANTLLMEKLNK